MIKVFRQNLRNSLILSLLMIAFTPNLCSADKATPAGKELLKNPNFTENAKDWFLQSAETITDKQIAGSIVVLNGVDSAEKWSHVGLTVQPVLTDQELKFSCYVRSDATDAKLSIHAYAYDKSEKCIASWHNPIVVETGVLVSENLYGAGDGEDECSQNTAKEIRTISGTEAELKALFEHGRRNFLKLMTATQNKPISLTFAKSIEAAAKKGTATELNRTLSELK